MMDRLSHILPKVLRKHGFEDHAMAGLRLGIAKRWLEKQFPQFQGLLMPLTMEEKTLVVQASDAASFAECTARSQELLAFVQAEAPGPGVESVRVLRA